MLGYILNLSPFLEFCPFPFGDFIFLIFFGPCFLIVSGLIFSFALSLLGASFDLIAHDFRHSIWALFSFFSIRDSFNGLKNWKSSSMRSL